MTALSSTRDTTETITTEAVDISDDPLICATEIVPEGSVSGTVPIRHIYLFWKLLIAIGRPRTRFIKPSIFLNPIAFIKSSSDSITDNLDDDYLPSSIPASLNLLGPLSSDSDFAGIDPHLSMSKLQKWVPKAPEISQGLQCVKTGARRLFRAAPLFLWRLRFVQYPGLADQNVMLACFDIEITQFAGCDVSLETLRLDVSHGSCRAVAADLPHRCRPAEQFTYIYKLTNLNSSATHADANIHKALTISLTATAFVSSQCTPKVRLVWQTALDLPTSRPVSLSGQTDSLGLANVMTGMDSATNGDGDDVIDPTILSSGISLTISAPTRVYVHETFQWEVIIVNRSETLQRLALTPISKRKSPDAFDGFTNYSALANTLSRIAIGNPVMDENVLFSLQSKGACNATELICLTPDVRIGSLGPSSCYVAHLKFISLVTGNLQLQALKVVDLTTQSSADILHLPSIVSRSRT